MDTNLQTIIPLLIGWGADRLLGDPERWPHPVVAFGRWIAWGERRFNRGRRRVAAGALFALCSIAGVYVLGRAAVGAAASLGVWTGAGLTALVVFYCLSGRTLVDEVRAVFRAVERSTEQGRLRVARIVGRDTSALDDDAVRRAALETLAENLSDGVVAPLFWFLLLGAPGMLAYKMVNTLDSMIGYRTERYGQFGRWAARIDDAANWVPARLTALLMLLAGGGWSKRGFVRRYGPQHASPNSGYPEAALAALLDCRFGGPNVYFGRRVEKPYIGTNTRPLTGADGERAVAINRRVEAVAVSAVAVVLLFIG